MQLKPITVIIVLSLVVASLLVAGCSTPATNPTTSPSSIPTVATSSQTPTTTPSTADYVALKVNSMTTSSQLGSYPLGSTPSPGNKYIVFDVTVANQNKDNLYLGNPLYFKLTTGDGTVYQYSPSSYFLDNRLTGVFNTNPGDKVTGKIAFEIPQSAKPTKLTYGDLLNGVVTVNL